MLYCSRARVKIDDDGLYPRYHLECASRSVEVAMEINGNTRNEEIIRTRNERMNIVEDSWAKRRLGCREKVMMACGQTPGAIR